eukprot:6457434-Amphidinium_carterae.1
MSEKEDWLRRVEGDAGELQDAPEELKGDQDVVLAAVARDGMALQWAAEELKADRDIVLAAVAEDGRALRWAAELLKSSKDIVLVAVAQDGWALESAVEALKNDREVVLTAVQQHAIALKHAADALLEDESFAVDARKLLFFFKVTALSGRSCIIADHYIDKHGLMRKSCDKLNLQQTETMSLLFGDVDVPEGNLHEDSPGCPRKGKLVEYQLIV